MRFYVNLNYFLAGNESDKLRIRHFFKFSSLSQLFLLDYFPPFTSSQFRTLMVTTGCLWFFLFHSLFCWSFYYFINIISNDFWKKKNATTGVRVPVRRSVVLWKKILNGHKKFTKAQHWTLTWPTPKIALVRSFTRRLINVLLLFVKKIIFFMHIKYSNKV